MPEQTLNRQMDVCTAHRLTSHRQDLDDRSLHDTVAESTGLDLRLKTNAWLDRLIRQGIEDGLQA
jgi:hypothetical protein